MSKIFFVLLLSLSLVGQRIDNFSYIQDGLLEIEKFPNSNTDFYLAIAELEELARELKIAGLVPDYSSEYYNIITTMEEDPGKKYFAIVHQLNWWLIRNRKNKSK